MLFLQITFALHEAHRLYFTSLSFFFYVTLVVDPPVRVTAWNVQRLGSCLVSYDRTLGATVPLARQRCN